MVQACQGIQPRFLGMVEHYQKGIGASRYFKGVIWGYIFTGCCPNQSFALRQAQGERFAQPPAQAPPQRASAPEGEPLARRGQACGSMKSI
ncbi:MAG: hypothetical protein QME83_01625 [Thermodesulfobacteriota bacterium]|nr:hypothetical protein [Thermodesulfobacteriota bacterium]